MPAEGARAPSPLESPRTLALLLILLSLAVSGRSLTTHRQLAGLGGMVDEWFTVGLNYRVYGTLGIEPRRSDVTLSPGYPLFVAAVASAIDDPPVVTRQYFFRSMDVIFLAHAVLLAAASAALFLWLWPSCGRGVALGAAVILGTGPYTVILVGLLHYDILHIFMVVVGCWILQKALDRRPQAAHALFLAGTFWGFSTLVRPVTIALPVVLGIALWLLQGRALKRAMAAWMPFVLGMSLVLAPYVARNHVLTGRWTFSAEGWMALWGSSVKDLDIHPNHYNWGELFADFMPTFTRVTGSPVYSRHAFIDYTIPLEDAFRDAAFRNIGDQPFVYVRNCVRSFTTFNLTINSVVIRVFQYLQTDATVWPSQDWFAVGHSHEFLPGRASSAFSWFVGVLTVLSVAGVIVAVRRRDRSLVAAGAVYASISAVHALVYMDLMYFYVKVPFLVIFSASALSRLPPKTATAGAALLVVFSLLLSWATVL